ncbi:MAG: hypothetical protein KC517_10260 [Bacteroidetes bacterium]|nr:hypothetical protein [Bacteroidota bacterium]
MTKDQSQIMPMNVLNELFETIQDQTSPNINPILDLADILNRSKESIYRRFRGESAFTLNELWMISQCYTIPFAKMFCHPVNDVLHLSSISLNNTANRFPIVPIIKGKAMCYFFTNTIPVYLIKEKTMLFRIKCQLWENLHGIDADTISIQNIDTLGEGQQVAEVWTSSLTVAILQELDFVLACGVRISSTDLLKWYLELLDILNKRILCDDFDNIQVYQSEVSFPSSIMLSIGEEPSVMVLYSDILIGVTMKMASSKQLQDWGAQMLKQCVKISGQSKRLKRLFYSKLSKPVRESAENMLSESHYQIFMNALKLK